MEAQIWALIGLLTASILGALFYLGARIDTLASRIDAQGAGLDSRIDGLNSRLDGLTRRVEEQGKALADEIYKLGLKLDDHLRRHAG